MVYRLICQIAPLTCAIIASIALAAGAACSSPVMLSGPGYSARLAEGRLAYTDSVSLTPLVEYKLESVSCGGHRFAPGSPQSTVRAEGAACVYYGEGISESYTALPDGIEQCWVINARPRSSGDLVISGRFKTRLSVSSSFDGVKLLDGRGRAVCRYGAVTVIDDRGARCRVIPRIADGRITIRIPGDFVAEAAFPILVDPVIGPEKPICPSFGPAPGNQEAVDIAAGTNQSLAVWQDSRGGASADIFATRMDTSGQVIDSIGISVCSAAGDQSEPAVAWNGREYLVVWSDRRGPAQHIYAARVMPSGEVIEKQGLCLSGTTGSQAHPRVAGDLNGWLVVWQDSRSSTDVYCCKVYRDGSFSKPMGVATRQDNEETPDVAWNGSTFFVVWTDYRNVSSNGSDVYGCRVAQNGVRLAGDVVVSSGSSSTVGATGNQRQPAICARAGVFFAAWEDCRVDSSGDIYLTRINSNGGVLNHGGIAISTAADAQELPALGSGTGSVLVAWRDRFDRIVKAARVNQDGVVVAPAPLLLSLGMAGSQGVGVAGGSGKWLVGWNNLNITDSDALGTVVTDSGEVWTPAGTTLSTGLVNEADYSVAFNGNDYAIVWAQAIQGQHDIFAARVSQTGELLTADPVNLTHSDSGEQTQPAIAWNGSKYLLVWRGDESFSGSGWDIRGCFVDSELTRLGTTAVAVCTVREDQVRPYAVSNGSNFFVVWHDYRNAVSPSYYSDICGAIVSGTGSVTPTAPDISLAYADQRNPKAASNGSNYFVVWEDYRLGYPLVYGSRVSSSGQAQDTNGVAFPVTTYSQTNPFICWGGGNYMVVWGDYNRISGARVSPSGLVLDSAGIAIDTGSKAKGTPSACWDGTRYQVVWEDYRSEFAGNADVYYNYVTSAGNLATEPTSAIVSDLNAQLRPRIISSGVAGVLFYSRYLNYANCACAVSLAEQAVVPVATIAEAKAAATGTAVALGGKTVTGAFAGYFYIEEADRSSGIRVVSSRSVSVNDVVDVVGTLSIADGERLINAGSLALVGVASDAILPLGIRGDQLGGGPANAYTPGITGAVGVNNIGILATTWGSVIATGSNYFTLQVTPAVAVKVKSGGLIKPIVGDMVKVTGIVTCEVTSGATCRAILPRTQADIAELR